MEANKETELLENFLFNCFCDTEKHVSGELLDFYNFFDNNHNMQVQFARAYPERGLASYICLTKSFHSIRSQILSIKMRYHY